MGLLGRLFGHETQETFGQKVIAALRQAGVEGPIEYDGEQFLLQLGENQKMFLGNVWDEYQRAPKNAKKQVIEHFVWVSVSETEMPDTFEEARDMLMPVVRSRAYRELMRLRMKVDGEDSVEAIFPAQVLAEHFMVTPVIDLPNRVAYVNSEKLDEWGVTVDQALEIGLENLGAPGIHFAGAEGHSYMSAEQDVYNASRVLLTEKIRQLKVQGRHVAAIPNREMLLITGSEDDKGLEMMANVITEVRQQPRFDSGIVLALGDDGWEPFLPPEDSPNYAAFRQHRIATLFNEYSEQTELLTKLHEQEGSDVWPVAYDVFQDKSTGRLVTATMWHRGDTLLLPRADNVGFSIDPASNDGALGVASWDRVVEVLGDLMEPTDYYPPRWLVRGFPSQEQLDALELKEEFA